MRRIIYIPLIVLTAMAAFVVLGVAATRTDVGDEAYDKAMRFDDAGTSEADIIREAGEPSDRIDASVDCRGDGGAYELVYTRESHALWGWLGANRSEILLCMGSDKVRRGRGVTFVEYH